MSHGVKKRFYYLLLGHEGKKRITEKHFKREVYIKDNLVLIHYIGDESLSVSRPHGN